MRAVHSAVSLIFALTSMGACDGDRLVSPDATASRNGGMQLDALSSASCQNVRGTATAVLDPTTGELVGSLSGDLTGTHRGSGTGVIPHGNGATTQFAQAIYETNEVGTFLLMEELIVAHVSPTLYKVTLRGTIAPGEDVTSGFLRGEGYLDVSGLPQGAFDYHGRICT